MPCKESERLKHISESKFEEARFFSAFNRERHQVSASEAKRRVKEAHREAAEAQSKMEFHRRICAVCIADDTAH
jgi:hypothetical protein